MIKKEMKITTKYNVILFCVLILFQTIKSALDYREEPTTLLDKLFNYDALIGTAVLIVLFICSALGCVWIVRSFWERFVSAIFQVRALTINESISILLIFAILSIS